MILRGQLRGKVGRRRDNFYETPLSNQRRFAFQPRSRTTRLTPHNAHAMTGALRGSSPARATSANSATNQQPTNAWAKTNANDSGGRAGGRGGRISGCRSGVTG